MKIIYIYASYYICMILPKVTNNTCLLQMPNLLIILWNQNLFIYLFILHSSRDLSPQPQIDEASIIFLKFISVSLVNPIKWRTVLIFSIIILTVSFWRHSWNSLSGLFGKAVGEWLSSRVFVHFTQLSKFNNNPNVFP